MEIKKDARRLEPENSKPAAKEFSVAPCCHIIQPAHA